MGKTLSIVTPAYNAGKVIPGAVSSLLVQLNDRVEWIIVDDGSTDDTRDVLHGLVEDSSDVVVVHSPNGGAGHARNVGMDRATGEWVSFLDADDLYTDGAIDRILEYLDNRVKPDTQIVYTPRLRAPLDDISHPEKTLPESTIVDDMPVLEFWTSIYRRDFLNGRNVRFFEYREQDIETAFRYIAYAQCEHLEVTDDLVFYLQRNNPDSNTHTWDHATLFYVKAMVYGDLILRFHTDHPGSLAMLERTFFECLLKYVKYGKWGHDARKQERLTALREKMRDVAHAGIPSGVRPAAVLAAILL